MRTLVGILCKFLPSIVIAVLLLSPPTHSYGQASSASLSISITDPSGAIVPDASVTICNSDTNQQQTAHSGRSGIATFSFLKPGRYSLTISKERFIDITVSNLILNVGDEKKLQQSLRIGSAAESVTVDGSGLNINTTDASVSTVIDRTFVANIPLNGRSFQDLISLTPGVVTQSPQASSSIGLQGDFSVNGQRTESNYYSVDGVSGNVGAGSVQNGLTGATGSLAATSALGTTQSLLSVDDLQEFRVESSSYSAEFGRSPGGQLTFVTRSGSSAYHGSAYDFFRNGWFDANDWFNDRVSQPKEELHQNNFGGTFGGPVSIPSLYQGKDKTFFFGSYEGLRMTEPVAATVQYVPDMYMRSQAPAAVRPLLSAFPLPSPNGIDYGTEQSPSLAEFFKGYSVPGQIDSSSIRIDETLTPSFTAFFRFADTPSSSQSRSYSVLTTGQMNVQTYTLGTTNLVSSSATNQFRIGYSRSHSGSSSAMDSFGGAVPVDLGKAMGNTTGVTGQTAEAELLLQISGAGNAELTTAGGHTQQHQWNITDTLDMTHSTHHLKVGIDFRHISTYLGVVSTTIFGEYSSVPTAISNTASLAEYLKSLTPTPVYNQLALFAQDDWQITPRLSLSGGLRWEVAPPPHNATSPQPYTAIGSLGDPRSLSLAPAGTPLWHTSWYNFAPRLGLAWQANTAKGRSTVVRAGGGVFFDTNAETASSAFSAFGFSAIGQYQSVPLPLTAAQQDFAITPTSLYTNLDIYPSHLQLPYTNEWNLSVEQEFGAHNLATISYVGSAGRRLNGRQELSLTKVNPLFGTVIYPKSGLTSDYHALQVKYQRGLSKGVNALVSYSWSHSIDYGSNFAALPLTRGNSDFDVRNNFQGGLTWDLPHVSRPRYVSVALDGWAVDGRLLARTAYPITLNGNLLVDPTTGSEYYTNVDLIPGEAIYRYGNQYPGGKSLNPAAFGKPAGANPGSAPRNFARGFGESQVNFAARRDFALSERTHLQFRAEAFNILNHPNFGYVDPTLTDATFGQATKMLDQSLGTVASQYQQGGPRSMQFSLRIAF